MTSFVGFTLGAKQDSSKHLIQVKLKMLRRSVENSFTLYLLMKYKLLLEVQAVNHLLHYIFMRIS